MDYFLAIDVGGTKIAVAVYQNNLPWENFEIGQKMRQDFPKANFILKSDVRAAAVGEWIAKGRPDDMFLYITVSTGLSASIIYRGNVIEGSGFAGEIGYMQDERGRLLKKVVSGSAMEREVRSEFHYGSLKEAFDAFRRGDKEMVRYFSKKASIIARCLYNIFTVIDPDYLVLGGGVIHKQSEFYHLIIKNLEGMAQHPGQVGRIDRIFKSTYKEMAGIYGLLGEV